MWAFTISCGLQSTRGAALIATCTLLTMCMEEKVKVASNAKKRIG